MTLLSPLLLLALATLAMGLLRRLPPPAPSWALLELGPLVVVFAVALVSMPLFAALAGVREISVWSRLLLSAAAMVTLIPALVWGRARTWTASAVIVGLSVLMFADLVHWRFFQSLLSPTNAGTGGQLWDVRASIWAEIHARDWALLPLALLGPLLLWLWPQPSPSRPRGRAPMLALLSAAALVVASLPVAGNVRGWMGQRFSWKVFSQEDSLASVGVLITHVRELARTLRERSLEQTLSSSELEGIRAALATSAEPARDQGFGAARGANLLLVQVESLQGWVIGARALGAEVTPFLNGLRDRSRYYPNVWDLTAGSPTADCEYMVLNAQHPLARGAVAFRRAHNDFVTVASIARLAGYTTLFAHAYKRGMWNRAILYPRYGFERVLFRRELGDDPTIGWGLADHALFAQLVPMLGALPSPWLAMTVTLTSHHPFLHMPPETQTLSVGELAGTSLGGYLHAMHYVDDALRRLFDDLGAAGLLDRTVVAVYGDHDSKLTLDRDGLDGARGVLDLEPSALAALAERSWHTQKIPLLVHLPPPAQAAVVATVGGQIDIGPTLLHHLGLPTSAAFTGRAMLGQPGHAVRHDGSAVDAELVFTAPEQADSCRTRSGAPVALAQCAPLRQLAEQELRVSWMVTSHNLAQRLHRAPIPQAAR